MKKSPQKNKTKEWKFTLSKWHSLPDIYNFVGSSFIVSRVDVECHDDKSYSYDIFIAPLPQSDPLSQVYKSIMDVTRENKSKRTKKSLAKVNSAKKRKTK